MKNAKVLPNYSLATGEMLYGARAEWKNRRIGESADECTCWKTTGLLILVTEVRPRKALLGPADRDHHPRLEMPRIIMGTAVAPHQRSRDGFSCSQDCETREFTRRKI